MSHTPGRPLHAGVHEPRRRARRELPEFREVRPHPVPLVRPWGAHALVSPALAGPAIPDPSSELCVKVREARQRMDHSLKLDALQQQHERLVAESRQLYLQHGYHPEEVEARMAASERKVEQGRPDAREARAAYRRLADDLLGKVPEPWPACEASN